MDDLCKAVEMLLSLSRDQISDGKPMEALSSVVHAIVLTQGEGALVEVLEAAKRRADRDHDIMSIQSALEEAHEMSRRLVADDTTILSERGEQSILKEAFEDGSSVVCTKCGSLIPRSRSEEHCKYWCEFADNDDNVDI
jgi:hypothetical protein